MRYILIVLLTFSSLAYATSQDVLCPNLDVIHQSENKLDNVTFVNNAYIANSPPFSIHTLKINWFAIVYNIRASSAAEALAMAKVAMQSASSHVNIYAKNLGGTYVCDYDGKKVELMSNEYDYTHLTP